MTFAEWKKTSKVFRAFSARADNYGIGLTECCQAAYRAGERQGRKDVEEIARRAYALRIMTMCRCGKNPITESHSCPYAQEIGGSTDDEYCDCCDECTHQCAMDI